MKKHYALINGEKVEVTKNVHDVVYGNSGESRRERYLLDEVKFQNEVSFESLRECEYPIEAHVLVKPQTTEDKVIQSEKYQQLYKALNKLNNLEKEVIISIFFDSMTERELAIKMGKHKTSIHRTKISAIKKLKRIIICNFL